MGVHTGEVAVGETGYIGLQVHRAARIAAVAHGGQVVVSAATAVLTDEPLTDLGRPERLFQLGDHSFPRLRSFHRSNLPAPATSFVGREEEELSGLVALLVESDARLVTLTGPGGAGKTRLAVAEAADAFPDGVWWVPLAAVPDASFVLPAIAQLLDIAEQPGRPLGETLGDRLLPDLQDHLVALLEAPGVVLLLTSRERLRLQAESAWPVAPLQPSDSVALFEARARSIDPGFVSEPAIDELCGRLDHLPLALERLGQRLDLLEGPRDLDDRHRTLRATIAWSVDLLPEPERRLAYTLSIFTGGSSYEDAEWVLETIREFAREQLRSSGEEPTLAQRHAEQFAKLATAAKPHLRGDAQERWLTRLDADSGNLRVALEWLGAAREAEQRLRLATGLGDYWIARGHLAEALDELLEGLREAETAAGDLRAEALSLASFVTYRQGAYEEAAGLLDEASRQLARCATQPCSRRRCRTTRRWSPYRGTPKTRDPSTKRHSSSHARTRTSSGSPGRRTTSETSRQRPGTCRARASGAWRACACSASCDTTGQLASLLVVAIAELGLGRLPEAASYVTTAFDLAQRTHGDYALALSVELAGAICAERAEAPQAARLLRGAARLRDESGSALEPSERVVHEQSRATIESQLAPHELTAALAGVTSQPIR